MMLAGKIAPGTRQETVEGKMFLNMDVGIYIDHAASLLSRHIGPPEPIRGSPLFFMP
jgi:hypothetical protein